MRGDDARRVQLCDLFLSELDYTRPHAAVALGAVTNQGKVNRVSSSAFSLARQLLVLEFVLCGPLVLYLVLTQHLCACCFCILIACDFGASLRSVPRLCNACLAADIVCQPMLLVHVESRCGCWQPITACADSS